MRAWCILQSSAALSAWCAKVSLADFPALKRTMSDESAQRASLKDAPPPAGGGETILFHSGVGLFGLLGRGVLEGKIVEPLLVSDNGIVGHRACGVSAGNQLYVRVACCKVVLSGTHDVV